MDTDLRTKAITAVQQATTERPNHVRLWAAKLLRKATGLNLPDVVPAVDWAIEHVKTVNLNRYRVRNNAGFGWSYRFPNGHEASVINDPHRPFRFEVLSDDPADTGRGRLAPGLTSEQVVAKLHVIAALPTR